jgi:hypothetical protein
MLLTKYQLSRIYSKFGCFCNLLLINLALFCRFSPPNRKAYLSFKNIWTTLKNINIEYRYFSSIFGAILSYLLKKEFTTFLRSKYELCLELGNSAVLSNQLFIKLYPFLIDFAWFKIEHFLCHASSFMKNEANIRALRHWKNCKE